MRPIQTQAETFAWRLAMPWYHNTDAELNPGDEIVPASERGGESHWKHLDEYNPDMVYFTKEKGDEDAEYWRGRNRYEVEPIGEIQRDPGFFWKGAPNESFPDTYGYMAPRARTVRKLPSHPHWEAQD